MLIKTQLLFYFFGNISNPRHWGHPTVPTSFSFSPTLKVLLVFLSSQPTIKLRECGHNQWSCWLTPRRPTSNALLRLIVSHSLNHKLAPSKVHDTSEKSAVVKSTSTVHGKLHKVGNALLYLLSKYNPVQGFWFQYKSHQIGASKTKMWWGCSGLVKMTHPVKERSLKKVLQNKLSWHHGQTLQS